MTCSFWSRRWTGDPALPAQLPYSEGTTRDQFTSVYLRAEMSLERAASRAALGREILRRHNSLWGLPSLIDPVVGTGLVVHQLRRLEPEADLLLRALHRVTAVDDVPVGSKGLVPGCSALLRGQTLGGAPTAAFGQAQDLDTPGS